MAHCLIIHAVARSGRPATDFCIAVLRMNQIFSQAGRVRFLVNYGQFRTAAHTADLVYRGPCAEVVVAGYTRVVHNKIPRGKNRSALTQLRWLHWCCMYVYFV